MWRSAIRLSALLMLSALFTRTATAVVVDGRLDPEYGPALATQSVQSHNGSAQHTTGVLQAGGSELDQAFAFIAGDTLFVLATGELGDYVGNQPSKDRHQFLLLDTGAPGQNTILGSQPSAGDLFRIAGLTLDAGFQARYALGSSWAAGDLDEEFCSLPPGAPCTGYRVGAFPYYSPQGSSLTGGPDGIQVGIDNSSLAGVPYGCGAASGAGVTTGIEWAVPLAAIGHPTGCVRICAFLFDGNDVTNQVLGSVPVGTCSLGPPATANFASVAGDQFFSVCSTPSPVRPSTWGSLKTRFR